MTVREGQTSDPNDHGIGSRRGTPLTSRGVTGPIFMMVTTTDPGTGKRHRSHPSGAGCRTQGTYAAVFGRDPILTSEPGLSDHRAHIRNPVPHRQRGEHLGRLRGRSAHPVDGPRLRSRRESPEPTPGTSTRGRDTWTRPGSRRHTPTSGSGTFLITLTVTDNGDGDSGAGMQPLRHHARRTSAPRARPRSFNGYRHDRPSIPGSRSGSRTSTGVRLLRQPRREHQAPSRWSKERARSFVRARRAWRRQEHGRNPRDQGLLLRKRICATCSPAPNAQHRHP